MCSIGGIDCVPKWKHVLTPSGICLELKLQHDPDFQALGKLTLNSNVLGLIVSTNLRIVFTRNKFFFHYGPSVFTIAGLRRDVFE